MRWCVSIGAVLVAGVMTGDVASFAAPNAAFRVADSKSDEAVVDVELVLAVDVSYSMDMDELALQREGYAQAIVSKDFLQTLKTGPTGKIAVTYFEWAASTDQKIIIPWRVIDGPESADAVAAEIMKTPVRRASRTSISGAINFAMPLFEQNQYRGLRRVIDISGDGPNNNGEPVTIARDAALEKGIVINGLPIMVFDVDGVLLERAGELDAAARHPRMRRRRQQRRIFGNGFGGLGHGLAACSHEPGGNCRLCPRPALEQATLDQQQVGAFAGRRHRRGRDYAPASLMVPALASLPSASNTLATMPLASSPAWAYIAFGES